MGNKSKKYQKEDDLGEVTKKVFQPLEHLSVPGEEKTTKTRRRRRSLPSSSTSSIHQADDKGRRFSVDSDFGSSNIDAGQENNYEHLFYSNNNNDPSDNNNKTRGDSDSDYETL